MNLETLLDIQQKQMDNTLKNYRDIQQQLQDSLINNDQFTEVLLACDNIDNSLREINSNIDDVKYILNNSAVIAKNNDVEIKQRAVEYTQNDMVMQNMLSLVLNIIMYCN